MPLHFIDGKARAPFDAIIYATGYRTSFPFLRPGGLRPGCRIRAALSPACYPWGHNGLIFAGLVQPIGPTIPLVEIQGQWIARALGGSMTLPDAATRAREVEDHLRRRRETWLDSPRYALGGRLPALCRAAARGHAARRGRGMSRSAIHSQACPRARTDGTAQ